MVLEDAGIAAADLTQVVRWPEGAIDSPIYDRAQLGRGAVVAGPAIVTQLDTTTVIAPSWTAEVHSSGALILKKGTARCRTSSPISTPRPMISLPA